MTPQPPALPPPSPRGPLVLGYAALAALFLGLGSWAALARIEGAVLAVGRVEPELNRLALQHPDGGRVAEVAVREGQTVRAGQLLLRLNGSALSAELALVDMRLREARVRRARLTAERDGSADPAFDPALLTAAETDAGLMALIEGQRALLAARRDTAAHEADRLARLTAQLVRQIAGLDAAARAIRAELALAARERADQDALLRQGLTQSGKVLALQREEARLAAALGQLAAARAEAEGRVSQAEADLWRLESQARSDAAAELAEVEAAERELAQRHRALTDRLEQLGLHAPVAGTVQGLAVFGPGAVITPSQPVLYLIPAGRPPVIVARVAATDIGAVFPGQPVRLRFPALDPRNRPDLEGRVERLSADAFTDEHIGRAYYRAEITLAPGADGAALIPGMPVEAFFATGPRSPIAYLLDPLTTYFSRALREG